MSNTATHYMPLETTSNVRCLNGGAHISKTRTLAHVTCDLCKNRETNKEFWGRRAVKRAGDGVREIFKNISEFNNRYQK